MVLARVVHADEAAGFCAVQLRPLGKAENGGTDLHVPPESAGAAAAQRRRHRYAAGKGLESLCQRTPIPCSSPPKRYDAF